MHSTSNPPGHQSSPKQEHPPSIHPKIQSSYIVEANVLSRTEDYNNNDDDVSDISLPDANVTEAAAENFVSPSHNEIRHDVGSAPRLVPAQSAGYNVLPAQELSLLRIMSFCDDAGCPRYFFDKLMSMLWQEVSENNFRISHSLPKRDTLMRHVTRICGVATLPVVVPVSIHTDIPDHGHNNRYVRQERDVAHVICFPFESQLKDLLNDDFLFGNLMNLDVKPQDRFGKFSRSDNFINEVNSACWYQKAYDNLIKNPSLEFLMPIIIFVDKTGTDKLQRHSVEPVLFTVSTLSWSARQKSSAWRALGFIPDLYSSSNAAKESARNRDDSKGRSHREYHACLRHILQSLVSAQKDGILFELRLGDQVKMVRLRVPVAFIMNDGKSADMLTGRYGSYNFGRVSRACDCTFENLSNTNVKCQYINHADISKLQEQVSSVSTYSKQSQKAAAELQELSIHVFNNAFDDICFGGDPRGIFGCTPTDLMHAFLEGVLRHAMKAIFVCLRPLKKVEIDTLLSDVVRKQKSCIRSLYPRTNFTKGFSNLTLLTANEWVGVWFTLMLLSMMDRGKVILATACTTTAADSDDSLDNKEESDKEELQEDDEYSSSSNKIKKTAKKRRTRSRLPCSVNSLREVLEALLCFYAWTKRELYYDLSTRQRIKNIKVSVARLLQMVKTRLPRDGNGWNLQKFHDLMHLVDDIHRFGSPRNTDAGCGERALKFFAKRPALTTQKRDSVFLRQLSLRLHETEILAKIRRITQPGCRSSSEDDHDLDSSSDSDSDDHTNSSPKCRSTNDSSDDEEWSHPIQGNSISSKSNRSIENAQTGEEGQFIGSHKFEILVTAHDDGLSNASVIVKSKRPTQGYVMLQQPIADWFSNVRHDGKYSGSIIPVWTEYQPSHGQCLRAHPNYRSAGSWNDWCMVRLRNEQHSYSIPPSSKKPKQPQARRPMRQEVCPAKLLCFYVDPLVKEKRALILAATSHDSESDSVLCEIWHSEYEATNDLSIGTKQLFVPKIRTILASDIIAPVLCFEEFPGFHEGIDRKLVDCMSRCLLVKDMESEWARFFS